MSTAGFASASPAAAHRRAEAGRYLKFTAGGCAFGLPVSRVREIIHHTAKLTHIPQLPEYISGCLNLRGSVVPVVDLRRKFQLIPAGLPDHNCIIVTEVRLGGEQVLATGLIVDAVEEVVQFNAGDLEPAPEFGGGLDTRFVQGMAKLKEQLVTLLNLDEVIAAATLETLRERVGALNPAAAAAAR